MSNSDAESSLYLIQHLESSLNFIQKPVSGLHFIQKQESGEICLIQEPE